MQLGLQQKQMICDKPSRLDTYMGVQCSLNVARVCERPEDPLLACVKPDWQLTCESSEQIGSADRWLARARPSISQFAFQIIWLHR